MNFPLHLSRNVLHGVLQNEKLDAFRVHIHVLQVLTSYACYTSFAFSKFNPFYYFKGIVYFYSAFFDAGRPRSHYYQLLESSSN